MVENNVANSCPGYMDRLKSATLGVQGVHYLQAALALSGCLRQPRHSKNSLVIWALFQPALSALAVPIDFCTTTRFVHTDQIEVMVNCCKCNSTGRCRNCACVKANKKCRGCLPSRLGHCLNVAPASSSDDSSNLSPPGPNSSLSASASVPDTPGTLQAQEPLPDNSVLPIAEPNFTWGKKDASSFTKELNESFEMAVHWKRNIFRVPQANIGKPFVDELARLYVAFANGSALESVSLKAAIVMPHRSYRNPTIPPKPKKISPV